MKIRQDLKQRPSVRKRKLRKKLSDKNSLLKMRLKRMNKKPRLLQPINSRKKNK